MCVEGLKIMYRVRPFQRGGGKKFNQSEKERGIENFKLILPIHHFKSNQLENVYTRSLDIKH